MFGLCRVRCSLSRLVSAFAFAPPDATYNVDNNHKLCLDVDIGPQNSNMRAPFHGFLDRVQIYRMKTRRGSDIIGFYFGAPNHSDHVVLFSHANAVDCGGMMWFLFLFQGQIRCNVFCYDYTGYGVNAGEPTADDTLADSESAYAQLIELGFSPGNIILYGQSVGSAPSCHLAARREVGGLILHSALVSGLQVISGKPACCNPSCFYCCCDVFRNQREIANVVCPVLMIHGRDDNVVPFWHGQALYNSCPNPSPIGPLWVDSANHNNVIEKAGIKYFDTIRQFVETIPSGDP